MATLTTRTWRTVADLPSVMSSVIARRDNNRNADDADLADCRRFAECDVRCNTNGHVEDSTLGKSAAVRQVRVVCVPIIITLGNHVGKIPALPLLSRREKPVCVPLVITPTITLGKFP